MRRERICPVALTFERGETPVDIRADVDLALETYGGDVCLVREGSAVKLYRRTTGRATARQAFESGDDLDMTEPDR